MILDTLEVHSNCWIYLLQWNYFFKLLYLSGSYASFKQNSVTIMWRKHHVMTVYFLSQLQRGMVLIRSARECDLVHITSPVTAEGFDGSHHPRFAEWIDSKRGSRYLSQGGSHRKRTRLIIWYFDFRISMDVSLLQEKSTFPVLTMKMSPHLEPFFFFFLIYDCILHKCCAISNQYHFTNPISTFLPKFQGVRTLGPPLLDPPMDRYVYHAI